LLEYPLARNLAELQPQTKDDFPCALFRITKKSIGPLKPFSVNPEMASARVNISEEKT